MEKQFKKTLASIQTRSNRSSSDTVREFFNCVSYTMIMNSLFQLERRELFYSGSNIYGFNQFAIQAGFIEKSIILTDRHKFSIEENFYNQFDNEIIDTANLISLEIQKQPLTDVFNNIFEECYLTGKKGEWLGQYLTPNDVSELLTELANLEKEINYSIGDICAGTGSLIFPLLRKVYKMEGYEGIQKIEILYNDIDPLMAQLFTAQILTNMIYHNLDFKSLHIHIGNAITEFSKNTIFLRVKQNQLVAQRVLEIDKEKKAA
ncbi:N-6 DNA methylase [Salmonella enterica]|nr:N-6 DNA methylase [Salmonella enterica]ECL4670427.1 N-6 DNA methylase [Salmonella enterica]ECR7924619.1 N-6 DNA methylase [Salmonella enterica]ECX4976271.1 N-6 DNA methylase [Salmonella enterica]EDU5067595.1 N-6 DNA methylase [Salmonella enterica]